MPISKTVTLFAEETLMCGLRKMPFVGSAIEITQGVAKRRAAIEANNRVSAMEAELSRFQRGVRDLVKETITESMAALSKPQIDGATLRRLITEFRDLNEHDYHAALFDGLFKHSTHYAELKVSPEHYGTLLDDQAKFPKGMFPIFLDVDKTRLLAVPPASLSLILSTSTHNHSQIIAPSDVWALPDTVVGQSVSHRVELPPIELIQGWSVDQLKTLQKQTAAALGIPVVHHDTLADGCLGPAMVVIPAGSYIMGSPDHEPERSDNETQRKVMIEQPFCLGETTVTFAEYDHYCNATGQEKPDDQGWGRSDRPVINVSWEAAVAYCQWLSEQTAQQYQLPDEAQWEYACRSGTTTPFWFGDQLTTDRANYDGNYPYNNGKQGDYREQTIAAKSFSPNPWGLYQMHGNVWEWCEDTYDGGEARVLRGGSWFSNGRHLRSASRFYYLPDDRFHSFGFRLARGQSSR